MHLQATYSGRPPILLAVEAAAKLCGGRIAAEDARAVASMARRYSFNSR